MLREREKSASVHYGPEQSRIKTWVLGHSLVHLFSHSHHSLACFIPNCWHSSHAPLRSLIRSLAHSLPSSWENEWLNGCFCFILSVLGHSHVVKVDSGLVGFVFLPVSAPSSTPTARPDRLVSLSLIGLLHLVFFLCFLFCLFSDFKERPFLVFLPFIS